MEFLSYIPSVFQARDGTQIDAGQELLELLQNPFGQQLQQTSLYTSLGTSIGITAATAFAFSFLRPYNQAVYAPKLKHADEKHAPPPILGRKPWSWVTPLWKTGEEELIHHVGMDATIFLRFLRMCRDIFLVLSLVGVCILVPIHLTQSVDFSSANGSDGDDQQRWISRMTPSNVWNGAIWGQVAVAWLFNIIVAAFLYWNYRKVWMLRRKYFETDEYQRSLHSRTLMMTEIPREKCSDEGIAAIIDSIVPSSSFARTAIARNVRDLPSLIEQHANTVRELEKVLARYLKDPDNLPAERPTCRPSKKDSAYDTYPKDRRLDAIDYLTQRIRTLEVEIKEVRSSVDRRSTMPYGFASYADIGETHGIAYACRKKHPSGATIRLAPRPNDIIWDNMTLTARSRSVKGWVNFLWVTLLTVLWIVPNAMIAVFLVNLSNLGKVWPAFQLSLEQSPNFWGAVQGILSPALLSSFYLLLPVIFRRLSIRAGDQTKTGRERHVIGRLYNFFVVNNLLIFTFFSTLWGYVAGFVKTANSGGNPWDTLSRDQVPTGLFLALCTISPFWITWLLQRNLGAAIDLVQLWPLVKAFVMKRFSHPTPRELIELTAPPAFDYASYYNYFLYYATVTLFYAGIQPLVLPAAAMYFAIDVLLKKYLLMYVFVTKNESGGLYWRVLFNRFIFATVLANCVVFLTAWVRGWGTHEQAYCIVPLPLLMICFKLYCRRAFDDRIHYYSTRDGDAAGRAAETGIGKESRLRSERLASRFGHPALYARLVTPMVHKRAQNVLHHIYKGRLTHGRGDGPGAGGHEDTMTMSGYSDSYALDHMSAARPGRTATPSIAGPLAGFEFVSESQMDFEHFKNRGDFADEHGGSAIYGGTIDRPDTPSSMFDSEYGGSRPGTPLGTTAATGGGAAAAGPQQSTLHSSPYASRTQLAAASSISALRKSPLITGGDGTSGGSGGGGPARTRSPLLYGQANDSSTGLVRSAAPPAMPSLPLPQPESRESSLDVYRTGSPAPPPALAASALGGFVSVPLAGGGYSGVPQTEPDSGTDGAGFDYFRAPRARKPGPPGPPPGSNRRG